MAKFILVYRGPPFDMASLTKEQVNESMEDWGAWMKGLGSALIDPGAPFGARTSVVDDGGSRQPADLNGYTIVEADDIEAARSFTDGHPHLIEGQGRFSIDIYELMPLPVFTEKMTRPY